MLPSLLARPTAFIAAHAVRRYSYGSAESILRLKRPTRGGQNLTDRHRRLEKSLRGKEARLKQIDLLTESSTVAKPPSLLRGSISTFREFVVPEEPKPPGPEECCMSGCAICVHDLYLDALSTYDEAVSSLRTKLTALNIAESEWPSNIRTSTKEKRTPNVSIDAFAALERALREKKEGSSNISTNATRWQRFSPREIYEGLRWVLFNNR